MPQQGGKVTYAVTSLCRERAGAKPMTLLWRGHCTTENLTHYVRDEKLREDRSQIHCGHAPQVLAALRKGLLNALRAQGWTSIAAAIRYYGASVQHTFAFLAQNAT